MHITDDPALAPRLRHFLEHHTDLHPQTSAERIRHEIRAYADDDRETAVPAGAVHRMLAFEERFGGLHYAVPGWPNTMEYGLDGDVGVHRTPLGWAFYGVVDGSLTAPLDVLLDGRVTARLGRWPLRVVDDSVEQRLTKHALLVELADAERVTGTCTRPTGALPGLAPPTLSPVDEASGGADLWWRGPTSAVWMHLRSWQPGQDDEWTVTSFAPSTASARTLLESLHL